MFPVEVWTNDLYYYIAGILKLKSYKKFMKWSIAIKEEIKSYLDWVKTYSKSKFKQLFESGSFRLIWRHVMSEGMYSDKLDRLRVLVGDNADEL